ncbi:MAG: NfeD family protein [Gammaproteobacteria bacterium]|jgi:membrane protein implicated in regulation of membrane protease activity
MQWWTWMIFGIALLATELLAIDAQFYLVFLGAGALVVGLSMLLGLDLPVWLQWVTFAIVSLVFMVTIRRKLYEKLRLAPQKIGPEAVGQTIQINDELVPGGSCRAEFRGTTWKAVNVDKVTLPAGSTARIDLIDGLTLHVRAAG